MIRERRIRYFINKLLQSRQLYTTTSHISRGAICISLVSLPDDENDKKSQRVLVELENIDDECDKNRIVFVKIDNDDEAKEYGIEETPTLVYFEDGVPSVYDG